nr:Chain C, GLYCOPROTEIN G1 [Lymphocytic choriomeningitis virus (strain WE)]3TBT_F Chain F, GLYCOPROTEIN G1 [Lymphocytic choriomeningitis virus (strain WE)]3TBT_I Chain I, GLYCOPROTEIN G1 [Lymphocytic choriomeningitis virus (strain WE)]3TBT_L Chain L, GLYCOPROTEIN G1 [Lymphocytic choriomeningitis virus (strain WE)]
KAPSNFATM